MEEFDEEYSCYGTEISRISDLADIPAGTKKLRVLHCRRLVSLEGLEDLADLKELNLSSNSIQRMECFDRLNKLTVLNLSTNNIRVISGLSGLFSLEKLILSFNNISSLRNIRQLSGEDYANFSFIDLRGNNISSINELTYLSECKSLTEVVFKGPTGSNPICSMGSYLRSVCKHLPDLEFLDLRPLSDISEDNEEIERIKQENKDLIMKINHQDKNIEHTRTDKNKGFVNLLKDKETKIERLEEDLKACNFNLKRKEQSLDEFKIRIDGLLKEISVIRNQNQEIQEENHNQRQIIKDLEESNSALKAELGKSEHSFKKIQTKIIDSSSEALKKYEELQVKYENVLEERKILCNNLNNMKDFNERLKSTILEKDSAIQHIEREIDYKIFQEKEKTMKTMHSEKEDLRQVLWQTQQEIQLKEQTNLNEIYKKDKTIENLQLNLQSSREKETKAKRIILEFSDLIKKLQSQIDSDKEKYSEDIKKYKESSAQMECDLSFVSNKYNILKQRFEESENQLNKSEDLIHDRNKQINQLKKELEISNDQIEESSSLFNSKVKRLEKNYIDEINLLKERVEELEISSNAKDDLINDQDCSISELRLKLKEYQKQIKSLEHLKNQYKDNIEEKLQMAYDDIEQLETKVSNFEDDKAALETKLLKAQENKFEMENNLANYEQQIKDKAEVVEIIENELKTFRDEQDEKFRAFEEEKINEIADLKEEFQENLYRKEKESSQKTEIIGELEKEIDVLKEELNKTREKLREAEERRRTIEKQKKEANKTISQLNKLFT